MSNDVQYIYNDIFKKIRLELGYTQKDFAEKLNCAQSLVAKIENNERPVTNETISALTNLYGVDLRKNIGYFDTFKNYEVYQKYLKLIVYHNINKYDLIDVLEKELEDPIIDREFNDGELFLLKNLSFAIVNLYKYKNYQKAIEYCLENIKIPEDELNSYIPATLKSPHIYSSFCVLTMAYMNIGKTDLVMKICDNLVKHYDVIWENEIFKFTANDSLYRKQTTFFYISYSFYLFKLGDYDNAIKYCDIALEICREYNILNMIVFSIFVKFQALYKKNNIDGARTLLKDFIVLKNYTEMPKQLYSATGFSKKDYPLIFDNITI